MKCVFLILAALGLSFAGEGSTYDHFRLPTALRPQSYDVRILTQLENPDDFRFNGTVKIQIEVLQNTHNITLHSKDLTIDDTEITLSQIGGEETTENCIRSTAVNPTHDFYILNTCKELLAGQFYELSLPFSAKLQDQLAGYYRSSYVNTVANETRCGMVLNDVRHNLLNSFNPFLDGSPLLSLSQLRLDWHFPASMNLATRHPLPSPWVITRSTPVSATCP